MNQKQQKMIWVVGLIILVAVTRLLPHPSNFTPVLAMALFAGAKLNRQWAWGVPLGIMAIGDLYIGVHPLILFIYPALVLCVFLGKRFSQNSLGLKGAVLGSATFFIISNLGVWIQGMMYPMTLTGLIECYAAAIPFFHHTLGSTMIYSVVLFGSYELLRKQIPALDEALIAEKLQ